MLKVNIYLNFQGNTEEAFNFYKSIFGVEFTSLVRFKDVPMEGINLPEEDKNKIMHISLPLGNDLILMGTDALECMGQKLIFGNNFSISVHPDSKEEADRLFNALAEGGTIEMPIADQFWGDYFGCVIDKFGVQWMINYHP